MRQSVLTNRLSSTAASILLRSHGTKIGLSFCFLASHHWNLIRGLWQFEYPPSPALYHTCVYNNQQQRSVRSEPWSSLRWPFVKWLDWRLLVKYSHCWVLFCSADAQPVTSNLLLPLVYALLCCCTSWVLFNTIHRTERQRFIKTNHKLLLEVFHFRNMLDVRSVGSLFSQWREIGTFRRTMNLFRKWLSILAQAKIGSTKGYFQFGLSGLQLLDTSARNLFSHNCTSKHNTLLLWRGSGASPGLRAGLCLLAHMF